MFRIRTLMQSSRYLDTSGVNWRMENMHKCIFRRKGDGNRILHMFSIPGEQLYLSLD